MSLPPQLDALVSLLMRFRAGADVEDLERFRREVREALGRVEGYVRGLLPHGLMECIAGFIVERCDNMLANVSDPRLRGRVVELALKAYEAYLKAYLARVTLSGGRMLKPIISSSEELREQLEAGLRGLLDGGHVELLVIPKVRERLFPFKAYYKVRGDDLRKVRRVAVALRALLEEVEDYVAEEYRDEVDELRRLLNRVVGDESLGPLIRGSRELKV